MTKEKALAMLKNVTIFRRDECGTYFIGYSDRPCRYMTGDECADILEAIRVLNRYARTPA